MPVAVFELLDSVVQMSRVSALSYWQLSPNGEREDWTVDVFPVYQAFPDNAEYYPVMSPVTRFPNVFRHLRFLQIRTLRHRK